MKSEGESVLFWPLCEIKAVKAAFGGVSGLVLGLAGEIIGRWASISSAVSRVTFTPGLYILRLFADLFLSFLDCCWVSLSALKPLGCFSFLLGSGVPVRLCLLAVLTLVDRPVLLLVDLRRFGLWSFFAASRAV